jgi:hypothetical protein
MLFWDKRWKEHEQLVADLNDAQRLNLTLGCIDQSIELIGLSVNEAPIGLRRDLEEALVQFWSSSEAPSLEALDEHLEAEIPSGFYDLIMAVMTLQDSSASECDPDTVLECLSYCYQSILDIEILSCLERNMTEGEVNELEKNNELCIRCIDDQLKLLENVSQGAHIERMHSLV